MHVELLDGMWVSTRVTGSEKGVEQKVRLTRGAGVDAWKVVENARLGKKHLDLRGLTCTVDQVLKNRKKGLLKFYHAVPLKKVPVRVV